MGSGHKIKPLEQRKHFSLLQGFLDPLSPGRERRGEGEKVLFNLFSELRLPTSKPERIGVRVKGFKVLVTFR
jgi:hypothetical protein